MGHLTTNANVACFYSTARVNAGLPNIITAHSPFIQSPSLTLLSTLWLYNCYLHQGQGELEGGRNIFNMKLPITITYYSNMLSVLL